MLGFQNEKGVKGHKKQAQETKNCRSKLNKPEFRVEVYRAEVKAEGEGWGVGRQEHTGLEDQNGGPGVLTCYKKSNTVEGGAPPFPRGCLFPVPSSILLDMFGGLWGHQRQGSLIRATCNWDDLCTFALSLTTLELQGCILEHQIYALPREPAPFSVPTEQGTRRDYDQQAPDSQEA